MALKLVGLDKLYILTWRTDRTSKMKGLGRYVDKLALLVKKVNNGLMIVEDALSNHQPGRVEHTRYGIVAALLKEKYMQHCRI